MIFDVEEFRPKQMIKGLFASLAVDVGKPKDRFELMGEVVNEPWI